MGQRSITDSYGRVLPDCARVIVAIHVRTLLRGRSDELVGFEESLMTIDDPEFVAASGSAITPLSGSLAGARAW